MQCNAMQCNAMQCNAMQCNAMQCNAMQCNAMQCTMRCNTMQCNQMQCNAMQCNAIQYTWCILSAKKYNFFFKQATLLEQNSSKDMQTVHVSAIWYSTAPVQWCMFIHWFIWCGWLWREFPTLIETNCRTRSVWLKPWKSFRVSLAHTYFGQTFGDLVQ